MLRHLNEDSAALRLEGAILSTLADGYATADLGGVHGTDQMVQAIIERL